MLSRLRYKLSLRDLAEMFLERGFVFTHERYVRKCCLAPEFALGGLPLVAAQQAAQ